MRYLLVNHIAAAPGSDPAHLLLPAEWARDVCATARAAAQVGIALTIATQFSNKPIRNAIEVVPDRVGFEHVSLPFYDSARSFLRERTNLQAALTRVISNADVVQLDHGGHPISLGHLADPIAKQHRRPTLWIVNGQSLPTSSLRLSAGSAAKRLLGRGVDSRLQNLLLDHLGTAGKVICNSHALREQLSQGHNIESECVEAIDALDSELASTSQVDARTRRLLDRNRPLRFLVTGEQTLSSGTQHVLRALHRCLRLRVPMELVILGDGVERAPLMKTAADLDIARFVRFSTDLNDRSDADVWIDSALTPAAEQSLAAPLAMGLAPIAYRTGVSHDHVAIVPSGYADGLSSAMFSAAMNREQLVARMLGGIEFARQRTLDAACRQRFAIARSMKGDRSRPAA